MDADMLETAGNIGGIGSPLALVAFIVYQLRNGKHVSTVLCDERTKHINESLKRIEEKVDRRNGDE